MLEMDICEIHVLNTCLIYYTSVVNIYLVVHLFIILFIRLWLEG